MKIDFMIAGFQKSATTKLKEMIGSNHSVSIHNTEEMTHFINKKDFDPRSNEFLSEYYQNINSQKVIGAKSVSVVIDVDYIKNLYDYNSNCKIILVLRNPIKRAYSAYWYCRRMGWEEDIGFEDALKKNRHEYHHEISKRNCDYINQGFYVNHIRNLYEYFPKERVKIYILEEDFKDLNKLNLDVCSFLEIHPSLLSMNEKSKMSNSSALPIFSPLTKILRNKSLLSHYIKKMSPGFFIRAIRELKEFIIKLNESSHIPGNIPNSADTKLKSIFSQKNKELEILISRDLSVWK